MRSDGHRSPRWLAMAGVCLIAACSGGGGGGGPPPAPVPAPSPSPTPTPTPTPTPPVTPPTTSPDTAEYRATVGAVSMNALVAYNAGASGSGVRVGVIDSGLDIASTEFAGRVSSASQSTANNGTYDDEDGHGTAVAFIAAGRRNGTGSHGIAPEATVIALRTDTPGSCADTGGAVDESGCRHTVTAIAQAIDIARADGARVINISLGGDSSGGATLSEAINRATAAGIVVVMSAGNEFQTSPGAAVNPNAFAQVANTASARGIVIIAGSVGAGDVISSFSNRAGNSANVYLAAVGERVRAPCEDTQVCLWSGTSFSAPQIAGAVALLAQAFPNLTGQQIVSILYASARDAGDPGVDAVYGRGVLDLARAFMPQGSMSVAGTSANVSPGVNGTLSAPMGDAAVGGLGTVLLDGYRRAYAMDLARTVNREGPARQLVGLLSGDLSRVGGSFGGSAVAVTIAQGRGGTAIERMYLRPEDAGTARALAATVTGRLGVDGQFAIAAAEGGSALAARLAGRRDAAFLVARDPTASAGFDLDVGGAAAVRHRFGRIGLTAAAETGDVLSRKDSPIAALTRRFDRYGYSRMVLGVDRRFGVVETSAALTHLREDDTLLGARFSGALGAARADTLLVDLAATLDAGSGWRIGGTLRQGRTVARLRGGIAGEGTLRTDGFALDLLKDGLFDGSDSFGLRIAQPMRVASGGLTLTLPSDFSYSTDSVSAWRSARLNLAPTGREVDAELRYARRLWRGDVAANLFWRRDPGHFAALPDDLGGAVRFGMAF